jgi:hypothetical protein
MTLGSGSVFG